VPVRRLVAQDAPRRIADRQPCLVPRARERPCE
jgi:hypothetical protein